jgi:hypothetical protein
VRREHPDDPNVEKLLRMIIGEERLIKSAKGERGAVRVVVRDLRRKLD